MGKYLKKPAIETPIPYCLDFCPMCLLRRYLKPSFRHKFKIHIGYCKKLDYRAFSHEDISYAFGFFLSPWGIF
jgi:hypothetical protein